MEDRNDEESESSSSLFSFTALNFAKDFGLCRRGTVPSLWLVSWTCLSSIQTLYSGQAALVDCTATLDKRSIMLVPVDEWWS